MELSKENLAETLSRVLPHASIVHVDGDLTHIAVPKGFDMKSIDAEAQREGPRRAMSLANMSDHDSFAAYVQRHMDMSTTVVWCAFNPQTFALSFTGVLDDHGPAAPRWRKHRVAFVPEMSAEWKAWTGKDGKSMGQVEFAEWIEEHSDDFAVKDGVPTSLEMLKMATEFQANEERSLKSTVKLQSGGVRLNYIADPDAGTTESMQMFSKFCIGIPVFHGGAAWQIMARLKYRLNSGKVSFFYELVRPDRVHNAAATELISDVRNLVLPAPVFMGNC